MSLEALHDAFAELLVAFSRNTLFGMLVISSRHSSPGSVGPSSIATRASAMTIDRNYFFRSRGCIGSPCCHPMLHHQIIGL